MQQKHRGKYYTARAVPHRGSHRRELTRVEIGTGISIVLFFFGLVVKKSQHNQFKPNVHIYYLSPFFFILKN